MTVDFELHSVSYIKERILDLIVTNKEYQIFYNIDEELDHQLNRPEGKYIKQDLEFPAKTNSNCFSDFKLDNKNFNYYYVLLLNLANLASTSKVNKVDPEIWVKIINNEFNRVNCLIAIVAWLTTDEWRWHKEYPDYNIPEDLSYGLVLDEPQAVISFSLYILGYKRELDLNSIDDTKKQLKERSNNKN